MISVVIPTLNAERELGRCFNALIPATLAGLVTEVVVADGGSSDGTLNIADAAGAHVVAGEKGRGQQMGDGARAAKGDWLLFLHADTALEPGWEREAEHFIAHSTYEKPCAAAFRFALDDFGMQARLLEKMVALRCAMFRLAYGDQGLLIPRRLYDQLGGYQRMALMEDVDLVRKIGWRRLSMMRARAVTSAERFKDEGYLRRSVRNLSILFLYALRVPVATLARLYG